MSLNMNGGMTCREEKEASSISISSRRSTILLSIII